MKRIGITSEYITLGQLLKFAGVISNGGEAKFFLEENQILINDAADNRRGRKLYPGDRILINGKLDFIITVNHEN